MSFEEQLSRAADEANKILIDSFDDSATYNHTFSPKFEKEMKRVIRKANHMNTYLTFKKIAGILLVTVLGSVSILTFNTEARNKLWGWTITQYENFVSYKFNPQSKNEFFDTDYYISKLPDGYSKKETYEQPGAKFTIYADEAGNNMCLIYSTSSEKFASYISLDDVQKETIPFKDSKADLYVALNPEDNSALVWIDTSTNNYLYLDGCFSTEELIKIAESVIVKE